MLVYSCYLVILCDAVAACLLTFLLHTFYPLPCACIVIQEPLLNNSFQQAVSNGEPGGAEGGGGPSNQISKAFDTLAKALNPATEGTDGAGGSGAK